MINNKIKKAEKIHKIGRRIILLAYDTSSMRILQISVSSSASFLQNIILF